MHAACKALHEVPPPLPAPAAQPWLPSPGACVQEYRADAVILAGYLKLIPSELVRPLPKQTSATVCLALSNLDRGGAAEELRCSVANTLLSALGVMLPAPQTYYKLKGD